MCTNMTVLARTTNHSQNYIPLRRIREELWATPCNATAQSSLSTLAESTYRLMDRVIY